MPRPIRTIKPPSAPAAAGKPAATKKPTKATKTTTTTTTAKPRTTRSGTKDTTEPHALLTPTSDEPTKKSSSPVKKASTRTTRSKPSPAPRTTRRKPAIAEPEPSLPSRESTPARTASPETQVPASSNAENRTPTPTQFRSSPPPMPPATTTTTETEATTTKRLMVLEFGSDAGYSPPPPSRPTSAQRPRLRELQPVSLEPLDAVLDSDAESENVDPRASPTPKRGRKSGFAPVEDEEPGRAEMFYIPGAEDEEAFTIYSDPKSPVRLPGNAKKANVEVDDTMRPPESSPEPVPAKMRKRRSSGAVVDSEDDVADAEDEAATDRKGKRRKAAEKAAKAAKTMTTADLRGLLPRRKKVVRAERDEFDVISTSEDAVESESDTDELARPATRSGRAATKKKAAAAAPKAGKKGAAATTTASNQKTRASAAQKSTTTTTLSGRVSKTYARKSMSSEKENDSPNKNAAAAVAAAVDADSSGDETVVPATSSRDRAAKLEEVVEKFREVDRWEMEFEDVSQGSLEVSEGSGGGR